MPASSSGLDLAAGTGLGALLPPSLPTGGILLVRAVSSPSRTLRRSGGIFSRRPLYSSQRHHRRPLLLPTDPLTSGSHLSGRTKNWAETVLTLILGRDNYLGVILVTRSIIMRLQEGMMKMIYQRWIWVGLSEMMI
jgi:hypothetical protein